MHRLKPICRVTAVAVLCVIGVARADVTISSAFGRGMVLQQAMPLPIWGWADAGEKVSVRLDQATQTCTAASDGSWRVVFPAMRADGAVHRIVATGKNTVTLDEILVGEVWIGSGQSNMARPVGKTPEVEATQPQIRLLHVPPRYEKTPSRDVVAHWAVCSPETVAEFSAVLFYFGARLREELKLPIGLISVSRGSTAIEQFLPPPKPGPLFNGSIAPLVPVAMRGIVWYQGEANVMAGDGLGYAPKMRAVIEGCRKEWGRDFPFYLVQIAPLKNYQPDLLPPLWEAQAASLKIPLTGLAATTDLAGNLTNIHPANKKDVGLRLALWALVKDYGRTDLVYSGPLFKTMRVEGNRARIFFHHASGGLKSRDGAVLTEFQIAGADGNFVPAEATIDGETVVVGAAGIASPARVRFGWHNAANPNLVNAAGLPAFPFHSDNWQGGDGL